MEYGLVKILVMSDSHGNTDNIQKAVSRESPELILHLGDNDRDCYIIGMYHPNIPVRTVKGNCDHSSIGIDTDEFTFGGKKFFMTHGNLFGVKMGLKSIITTASARGAEVILFGHTHKPYFEEKENITIVNPGSIGMNPKTYAVLEIKNSVITCEHKKV